MARLASIAKAGFYPINEFALKCIMQFMKVEPGTPINVLDPCMGQGEALKFIDNYLAVQGAIVTSYGCELSQDRWRKSVIANLGDWKENGKPPAGISRFVNGAAELLDIRGHFGLIYLNPPFDRQGEEERQWLDRLHPYLTNDGVMILVTTKTHAGNNNIMNKFSTYYDKVQCYHFPDGANKFDEVVIMGTKRAERYWYSGTDIRGYSNRLTCKLREQLATTQTSSEQYHGILHATQLTIPESKMHGFGVKGGNIEKVFSVALSAGLTQDPRWQHLTHSDMRSGHFNPVLPMSEGHIAAMIGSGSFDGIVIHDDDLGKCIISGYAIKRKSEAQVEETETQVTETVTERVVIMISVLSLDQGTLTTLSSDEREAMEKFILRNIDKLRETIHTQFKAVFDPATMMGDYLPFIPVLQSPKIMPGATRIRDIDGHMALITAANEDGYTVEYEDPELNIETPEVALGFSDIATYYRTLMPAQAIAVAAMTYTLENVSKTVAIVGEMGWGKTSGMLSTAITYLRKRLAQNALGAELTIPKILVVAPGHLKDNWYREVTAICEQIGVKITVIGDETLVRNYTIVADQVVCASCGYTHKKLSEDKLFAARNKNCKNPTCQALLLSQYRDLVRQIDDAFAEPGLGVIILSKETAKLGAEWVAAYNEKHKIAKGISSEAFTMIGSALESPMLIDYGGKPMFSYAKCPKCGAVHQSKEDGDMHVAELAANTKKQQYCAAKITSPIRGKNGELLMEDIETVSWGYSETGAWVPKKVTISRARMSEETCGEPLYQFARLRSKGKEKSSYGAWLENHTDDQGEFQAETEASNSGTARWEVAKLITERHANEYILIVDEIHWAKAADSTQGYMLMYLVSNALRVIAGTGTIYGGKASTLFSLLYRLSSQFRETWKHDRESDFVNAYGVHEYITTMQKDTATDESRAFGRYKSKSVAKREGNGANPMIVKWLLPFTVFGNLDELGIQLPPKHIQFHWMPVDPELQGWNTILNSQYDQAAKDYVLGKTSRMSHWIQAKLGWLLCPTQAEIYISPEDREKVQKLVDAGKEQAAQELYDSLKEIWAMPVDHFLDNPLSISASVAEQIKQDAEAGHKSLVFAAGMKRQPSRNLYMTLKAQGLRVAILTTDGDTNTKQWAEKDHIIQSALESRETNLLEYMDNREIDVLITNPVLVATGLNLVQFSRAHYVGLPTYSIYPFIQAMSRIYRPGQFNEVFIHFWAYGDDPTKNASKRKNELMALAIAVMAAKEAASNIVSGKLDQSLAALTVTDSGDIMKQITDELRKEGDTFTIDTSAAQDRVVYNPIIMSQLHKLVRGYIEYFVDRWSEQGSESCWREIMIKGKWKIDFNEWLAKPVEAPVQVTDTDVEPVVLDQVWDTAIDSAIDSYHTAIVATKDASNDAITQDEYDKRGDDGLTDAEIQKSSDDYQEYAAQQDESERNDLRKMAQDVENFFNGELPGGAIFDNGMTPTEMVDSIDKHDPMFSGLTTSELQDVLDEVAKQDEEWKLLPELEQAYQKAGDFSEFPTESNEIEPDENVELFWYEIPITITRELVITDADPKRRMII